MSKFMIIELTDQDFEDQAEAVYAASSMFSEGFTSNLDKPARFEVVDLMNHQDLSDVVNAVRVNDE